MAGRPPRPPFQGHASQPAPILKGESLVSLSVISASSIAFLKALSLRCGRSCCCCCCCCRVSREWGGGGHWSLEGLTWHATSLCASCCGCGRAGQHHRAFLRFSTGGLVVETSQAHQGKEGGLEGQGARSGGCSPPPSLLSVRR